MMRFTGNLLAARQDGFDRPQGHGRGTAFSSLNDARNHLADLFLEFVDQRIAFGFADLLNDYLLCRLSANSPDHLGIDHFAVTGPLQGTCFAVDRDHDVRLFAVLLSRSRNKRRLDRLKDVLRIDVLVSMQ